MKIKEQGIIEVKEIKKNKKLSLKKEIIASLQKVIHLD